MKRLDYKWTMLLMLSAAYFLAQGTRQIYSTVLPQIKADFAVSDTQLGLVSSIFTLAFGIVIPFAGIAADFFRRKWMIVAGALVFSCGIFLSGFAAGIGLLVFTYGILNGAGQSLMPPSNSSLIGQLHVETRGTAFSIYQTAIYLGIVSLGYVASLFTGLGAGGWRWAFWTFGAIGIGGALVLALALRDTPQPKVANSDKASVGEALGAFLKKPSALLLMAALGCYFFASYGFKTWSPMFFRRLFADMTNGQVAFHSTCWFYLGAFLGVMLGGRISDKLKTVRPAVRFEIELVGMMLFVPFILFMALASSLPAMCLAIGLFGFSTGVYDSNLYASLMDVISPRYRAAAVGIFGCGGCVIGAFGPAVMGVLNESFSMRISFGSLAAFAVLGVLVLLAARLLTFARDRV